MNHHISPHRSRRMALILIALLAITSLLPAASRASVSPAPQAIAAAAIGNESEPNNTIEPTNSANFILLDQITTNVLQKTMLGTIDGQPLGDNKGANGDWYRFTAAKAGASVSISLTDLPADYDIALVSDVLTAV